MCIRDRPCVYVIGPTASGKSDLAIELAKRWQGEIVNADSMQVYCELNIGSAKVPLHERQGIVHHLLDVVHVGEPFSVAAYKSLSEQAMEGIHRQGPVSYTHLKDCILMFRLGDFYEMFFEDAEIASRELEIVLTGRDCGPVSYTHLVVQRLKEKGAVCADAIEEVPCGGTLVIRSHGAPPSVYRACQERGLYVIDATLSLIHI